MPAFYKNPRIIVLNGPPRCGKDTIGDALHSRMTTHAVRMKFAEPLKKIAMIMMQIEPYKWQKWENRKDEIVVVNNRQLTYRNLLIEISEKMVKPLFGSNYFGRYLGQTIVNAWYNQSYDTFIITDCGFDEEFVALYEMCGSCTYLIKIEREGTSFDGDSRDYVNPPQYFNNILWVENNREPINAVNKILKYLS